MTIRIDPNAHDDLRRSSQWYEDQRPGLGHEFLEEVDMVFTRIGRTPLRFPEVEPNVRRALLRRFPFAVYFSKGDVVEIIAVLHMRRDPESCRTRS